MTKGTGASMSPSKGASRATPFPTTTTVCSVPISDPIPLAPTAPGPPRTAGLAPALALPLLPGVCACPGPETFAGTPTGGRCTPFPFDACSESNVAHPVSGG